MRKPLPMVRWGEFDAFTYIYTRMGSDPPFAALFEHIMSLSDAVVLVVEDSPIIRESALEIVRTAGFQGVGARSADEAIGILEARADIRLVFTDVEMPGTIDGVKLAHYIRDRWPQIGRAHV